MSALAPIADACLALEGLAVAWLHYSYGEYSPFVFTLLLAVFAALVVYGRLALRPLSRHPGAREKIQDRAKSPDGLDVSALLDSIEPDLADAEPEVQWTGRCHWRDVGDRSLPFPNRTNYWLEVENRRAIQCLEVADANARLMHVEDLDAMKANGIRPIGGAAC